MSYVKLFTVCSDFALGFQTLNQGLDNNRAIYDQFDVGHSVGRVAWGSPDAILGKGRHDDPLVARTVVDVEIDSNGDPFGLLTGPLMVGVTHLAAGTWRVQIGTGRIFYAFATIKGATAGVARQASAHVAIGASPYVDVSTWNCSAGEKTDYSWSLVVYAEGVL